MPGVDKGGLSGESAKEVWLPPVLQAEHEEREVEFRATLPKGMKALPAMPYDPPWMSIGVAPTEKQVERNDYEGAG